MTGAAAFIAIFHYHTIPHPLQTATKEIPPTRRCYDETARSSTSIRSSNRKEFVDPSHVYGSPWSFSRVRALYFRRSCLARDDTKQEILVKHGKNIKWDLVDKSQIWSNRFPESYFRPDPRTRDHWNSESTFDSRALNKGLHNVAKRTSGLTVAGVSRNKGNEKCYMGKLIAEAFHIVSNFV